MRTPSTDPAADHADRSRDPSVRRRARRARDWSHETCRGAPRVINVSDVDAAKSFYVDVLGLTERTDRPDFGFGGAWLDSAASRSTSSRAPSPEAFGQHFAIAVDDLDAVVDELRGRGVRVSDAASPWPPAASRSSRIRAATSSSSSNPRSGTAGRGAPGERWGSAPRRCGWSSRCRPDAISLRSTMPGHRRTKELRHGDEPQRTRPRHRTASTSWPTRWAGRGRDATTTNAHRPRRRAGAARRGVWLHGAQRVGAFDGAGHGAGDGAGRDDRSGDGSGHDRSGHHRRRPRRTRHDRRDGPRRPGGGDARHGRRSRTWRSPRRPATPARSTRSAASRTPTQGGMGVHYIDQALMDDQVDITKPEALVYELDADGHVAGLVAHEYIVPIDAWTAATPPKLFGMAFHRTRRCRCGCCTPGCGRTTPPACSHDWNPAVRLCPAGVPIFGKDLPARRRRRPPRHRQRRRWP